VYRFLVHAESAGALKNFSSSVLPMQRYDITECLKEIRLRDTLLSSSAHRTLERFETEFRIRQRKNVVVIPSKTDSTSIFFDELISDNEKLVYFHGDSSVSVSLSPLGSLEYRAKEDDSSRSALLAQFGFRLFGSIGDNFGYFLQATNGSQLSGEKSLALEDVRLRSNIKFDELNSDFDFTESHLVFMNDWFWASVGREQMVIGSGFQARTFLGNQAPPMDALQFGARFENFRYRFMHASLLSAPVGPGEIGFGVKLINKFFVFHRFAIMGDWGEIAFNESIIYSDRDVDLAYLNPLSFFKSLEHSLRDRDNSAMGLDAVLRPYDGVQIKAAFFLDDIIFSEVGKGFWGNKTAWNIGTMIVAPKGINTFAEYARVEPYNYSHFNFQNAMTNDRQQFANILPPNSDRITAGIEWWYGNRYPLTVTFYNTRHGRNIVDSEGEIVRNVGGDVERTRDFGDSDRVEFLDGDLLKTFTTDIQAGFEIIRGWNIQFLVRLENRNGSASQEGRIGIRFEDF
jgi:hypothetical protein